MTVFLQERVFTSCQKKVQQSSICSSVVNVVFEQKKIICFHCHSGVLHTEWLPFFYHKAAAKQDVKKQKDLKTLTMSK